MKVLFVASGNKTGQPGAVVQNQAITLTDTGIEIEYFLIIGKGMNGYLKNVFPLIKHLKNNKYDVIHSHYSLTAFVTTLALWFIPGKTHIVSLMGSDTKLKGIFKRLVKLGSNTFWSKTIVKSRQMLEDSELKNAEIIPNGVDLQKIERIKRKLQSNETSKNKTNQPVVLFAANPSRESKNFPLAEQAIKNISSELKVVYNLSHEEIIEELFKADVLLSTSLWEGSPNLIKEAMACNCPVVSTNVGDVEWLFENEPGCYLTTFESEDVAEKIKQALEFARTNSRSNGRKRILELKLDAESVAKRLVKVYEEAMRGRSERLRDEK